MVQVRVPIAQLSAEALAGLVEEFVSRDGTDYGMVEATLQTRASQLLRELKSGRAVIVFDTEIDGYAVISAEVANTLLED